MKHDDTHFNSDPHSTPSLDPELEARVVAWVLGEASPVEAADLERRCAAEPALAEFKRRIEATHGLVCAAERPAAAGGGARGEVWRMEQARRAELLAKLGGSGAPAAGAEEGTNLATLPMPEGRPSAWRAWVMPMAACVTLLGLLAAVVVPTIGTVGGSFGVASKKASRPAPVEVSTRVFAIEAPAIEASSGFSAPAEDEARVAFQLPVAASAPATPPATPVPAAKPAASRQLGGKREDVAVAYDQFTTEAKDANFAAAQGTGGFAGGGVMDGAYRLEAVSGEVRRRESLRAKAAKAAKAAEADGQLTATTLSVSAASDFVYRDANASAGTTKLNEELTNFPATEFGAAATAAEPAAPVLGGAMLGLDSKADASKLSAEGRNQYIAGDLDAAQMSFRLAETFSAEDAEAKYFLKRIAEDKATAGALEREKTRALMVEEVAKSWQRPGEFKANRSNLAATDAPGSKLVAETEALKSATDDAPLAKAKVAAPPFDESLRVEVATAGAAVSTFSLHVGDASFRLAKAALERGAAPDPASIRPEEFYNTFDYGDPAPAAGEPVACRVEQAAHLFLQQRNLVRIALRVPAAGRGSGTPLHLTVLLDTSGSMEREDRAATVKAALGSLAALLGPNDRVTLVGFARQPRLLAESLSGDQAGRLAELAASTPAEGGTNLEEALKLAGELARRQWQAGAQNRIVLLTDGAANLGDADPERLSAQVETLRRQGVAFDACGVGADGLDDGVLEALTRKGDGRYEVLNSPEEADAGFARKLAGAFRPAAENVKVQVRFNPARVARYRLIGFEKHRLREEDFRNDQVDAAELAAEEAAVALYQVEVIPGDDLGELGDVAVRFRDPARGEMVERNWNLAYEARPAAFDRASPSLRLAGASALLAEKLRGGALAGQIRLDELAPVVAGLRGAYAGDARVADFLRMFDQTRRLTGE